MKTRILVLVLLFTAHGQLFGEDKAKKLVPLDKVFQQVLLAQHEKRNEDAVELLLNFISKNPAHEQIALALETLKPLYHYSRDPDGKLPKALKSLTAQGEKSLSHMIALNWIKSNPDKFPWQFGHVPELLRASKDAPIRINPGRVYYTRDYVPAYRLYRVPLEIIGSDDLISNGWASTLKMAEDVPRDKWEEVKTRVELLKPNPKNFGIVGSMTGPEGESYDSLNADLSSGGVFALEQTIDGFTARSLIHVPKFGMFTKSIGKTTFVYAADIWTGKPVAKLEIEVRSGEEKVRLATNEQGVLNFPKQPNGYLVARLGDDIQVSDWTYQETALGGDMAFITTDRPIYRPNQTVRFKVVVRTHAKQSIVLPEKGQELKVEIRGPLGRVLKTENLMLNAFGALSGSFQLTDEPALGEYRIVVPVERPLTAEEKEWVEYEWEKYWTQSFEVAEYRKPEFEVTVSPIGDPNESGEQMKATVNARYYFGGAVKNADVQWKVVAIPTYATVGSEQYKPFEDPRAWFYESQPVIGENLAGSFGFGFGGFGYWSPQPEAIADGIGKTDEHGNMEISFSAKAGEGSMKYTVSATVRDASRMTADGSAEIETHESPFEISVGTTRNFYKPGEQIDARVRLRTQDGKPAANKPVKLSVFLQVESGMLGEVEFESFSINEIKTGADGLATLKITAPESGRLRLRAATQPAEGEGKGIVSRADVWIAGEQAVTQLDDFGTVFGKVGITSDGFAIQVDTDLLAYVPGEKIRVMVRSSKVPIEVMLLIEGEELQLAKAVRLEKRCEIIEIPVTREMPNRARINAFAWLDGEFVFDNSDIAVLPAENILDVVVDTGNTHYAPGQKASVSLVVKDAGGRGVAAEVELGIVDESLFALAEDQSTDIRSFFFPSPDFYDLGGYGYVSAPNDSTYPEDTFGNLEDGSFGGGGWGGGGGGGFGGGGGGFGGGFFGGGGGLGGGGLGGGGGESRPFVTSVVPVVDGGSKLAGTEIRKKFADTFYWSGHVQTGEDGKVQLELDVPDTLSQWRIVARAVSGPDKFGFEKSSVVTRKDVIVRLSSPRFFTEGDKAVVSSVVSNNTQEDAKFVISLQCEGAKAAGEQTQTISAGGQARVDWPIEIELAGQIKLQTKALSANASDAMELQLPVRPYGIEKRIAINGRLEKGSWETRLEIPKDADLKTSSLQIVVNGAGTAAVREALPYLADYPYGCVEQTMSRFLPAVVASGAMKRQNIENDGLADELPAMVQQGLQRLYRFQHDDGGWGWWKDDDTDEFMTTYVLYGLLTAREAGYDIDPQTIEDGIELLRDFAPKPFNVRVQRLAGVEFRFDLEDVMSETDDDAPRREAAPDPDGPDNPFGNIGEGVGREVFVAARVASTARKRTFNIEELAWLVLAGYHKLADELPIEPPAGSGPNEVRETALVIRALLAVDPKDERIQPLVDWLMQQRRGGAWYSTLDTAYAVYALSEIPAPVVARKVEVNINGKSIEAKAGSLLIPAEDIRHGQSLIHVKTSDEETTYASVLLKYFATDLDKPSGDGSPLLVQRKFERSVMVDGKQSWAAIASGGKITINDELRVTTTVRGTENLERVMIESPIPAGTEVRDTETVDGIQDPFSSWYARREVRDDRVSVAVGDIAEDERSFDFRLRPTSPGVYRILPAIAFPMYNPDQQGHSAAFVIEVVDD